MLWNKVSSFILLLILFFQAGSVLAQPIAEKVIEAEGIAAVMGESKENLLLARDEAIKRALRRAIEEGVGNFNRFRIVSPELPAS